MMLHCRFLCTIYVHFYTWDGECTWFVNAALQPRAPPLTSVQPYARVLWSVLDQGTVGLSFADLLSMRRHPLAQISIFLITNEISRPRISVASVLLLGVCAGLGQLVASVSLLLSSCLNFWFLLYSWVLPTLQFVPFLLPALVPGTVRLACSPSWLPAPAGQTAWDRVGSVESERQAFKIVFCGEIIAQLCLFQEENHVSKDHWYLWTDAEWRRNHQIHNCRPDQKGGHHVSSQNVSTFGAKHHVLYFLVFCIY